MNDCPWTGHAVGQRGRAVGRGTLTALAVLLLLVPACLSVSPAAPPAADARSVIVEPAPAAEFLAAYAAGDLEAADEVAPPL
jgi:hypothetical protein